MRFFWQTALLTCKRMLRRPGMLLLTLLLPLVCALAGSYLSGGGEVVQIRVGIAIAQGDEFGNALYEGLQRFDSPIVFERHTLENRAYLEREVAAGRMECAYLISPDLGASLRRGRARGGIEVLTSPQTMLDMLAGEMILASMLREISPQMSRELLTEVLGLDEAAADEIVARKYAYYNERAEMFLAPVFFYRGGAQAVEPPSAPVGARVLHGVVALFVLAGVIWSLPGLIGETPGILRRLSPGAARAFMLGTAAALFFTGLIQGALGLAALAITHPAVVGALPATAALLTGYLLSLSLAGTAAILLLNRSDIVYAGGSFLLLLTALLGGAIIDLGEISPHLGSLSVIFPSRYYIGGVLTGSLRYLSALLAFAGVFAALSVALTAKRKK